MSDKKNRLIEAGMFSFSINGIVNTRIEDITKQARVAKGTFYTYFSSKEDLLATLTDEKLKNETEFTKELLKLEIGLKEKMKKYIERKFKHMKENPEMFFLTRTLIRNGEISELEKKSGVMGKYWEKSLVKILESAKTEIKNEYQDELYIISSSITVSLFTYGEILLDRVKDNIEIKVDYVAAKKELEKLEVGKYVDQFYNLNIKGLIKED